MNIKIQFFVYINFKLITFYIHKMKILLILFFIIVIICVCIYCSSDVSGAVELVLNKTTLVDKKTTLGYANFESFVNSKKLNFHLICIIGADKSGRSHLAKMISKKYDYKVIDERDDKGKRRDIPNIRKEYFIDNIPIGATAAEIAGHKKRILTEKNKRYVITGDFTDDDLERLFKGNNYNRNFLLLFVQPKDDRALVWSRLTNEPREDYGKLLDNTKKILASHKRYRIYILQNDFNQ